MPRQRRQLLPLLAGVALLFCIHNVYQSLSGTITSSHAYFQRDDSSSSIRGLSQTLGKLFGRSVHADQKSQKVFNSSEVFNSSDSSELREISQRKHRQAVLKMHKNPEGNSYLDMHIKLPPDPPPCTKLVNDTELPVPLWQRRLSIRLNQTGDDQFIDDLEHRYFLVELLQVRIYEDDDAKWTLAELKQWMHFMFLSGVEHIYICDHYKYASERLEGALRRYIDLGLVTYMEWGSISHPLTAQIKCYQHIINEHKYESIWQVAVDMDEYPFSLNDTKEDFLVRFLQQAPPYVSEVSMRNYLMLGQGDRSRDIIIDRIDRMTPHEANVLVKPIYRPEKVHANVHRNHILMGRRTVAPPPVLKMLHYWGARVQHWGPDTPDTLAITIEMTDMRNAWAEQVRNSLLVFGEFDAFNASTGP